MPFWHEAEVGAPTGRRKTEWKAKRIIKDPDRSRLSPAFPDDKWPTLSEAKFYGYATLKDCTSIAGPKRRAKPSGPSKDPQKEQKKGIRPGTRANTRPE